MSATSFAAMGTSWWIRCDISELLDEATALVHQLEQRLSRFRPDSSLARLNRERRVACPTLAAVTRRALELRAETAGAFDPTLGAELAELGYDRSFEQIRPGAGLASPARQRALTRVVVGGDAVHLVGPGALDLGGLAKGYAVDRVVALLVHRGASEVLVDGGGDIRGAGPSFPISVADGLVVETHAGAIATSSTRARRWLGPRGLERHHILDPQTNLPSESRFDMATVVAPDALTADALATAILVSPADVIARLATFAAHALVRAADGRWWSSPGAPITACAQATTTYHNAGAPLSAEDSHA